jgi:hypothetical protein
MTKHRAFDLHAVREALDERHGIVLEGVRECLVELRLGPCFADPHR